MKIKEIAPNIFLATYDTQYDLCMSFVRIQEFYESPEFKRRYFTLEEFIDWWSLNVSMTYGSFDYPSRWCGFNIPGKIIYDWLFECDENILRDRELDLIRGLAKSLHIKTGSVDQGQGFYEIFQNKMNKIYLIGCHKKNTIGQRSKVIDHEMAHAMYALNAKYKERCDNLLKKMGKNTAEDIDSLIKKGYDKSVIDDELQAYYSTGCEFGKHQQFINNFKKFACKK